MLRTIKSGAEIDALFGRGSRTANTFVVVIAAPTEPGRGPEGRVVFVAGKKIGNAVFRNRSRRVLRAAVQRTDLVWPGWDVALIARPATATAPPSQIDEALRSLLARIGAVSS